MGLLIAAALAVIAGAIPLPVLGRSAVPQDAGETARIYVLSNGFHSDIAVPADTGRVLQELGLDPADYPVDVGRVRYWAFGWGSRTAYTSLVAVSDLTFEIAAKALAFDTTVMHVLPLGAMGPGEGVYAYDVSGEALARLKDGIKRSFGDDVRIIPEITQGFGDRFYKAEGRFSPIAACNVWTGRRLRESGIGVGLWTPFAQSLEFGLERTADQAPSIR